jgi:hypothetical protein
MLQKKHFVNHFPMVIAQGNEPRVTPRAFPSRKTGPEGAKSVLSGKHSMRPLPRAGARSPRYRVGRGPQAGPAGQVVSRKPSKDVAMEQSTVRRLSFLGIASSGRPTRHNHHPLRYNRSTSYASLYWHAPRPLRDPRSYR